MKQKHFIDSHKGATPVFILMLMSVYGAWDNPTAWLYLATHGLYGVLWVIKSATYPDRSWEAACSAGFGALIWAGLSLYWIAPWIICAMDVRVPPAFAAGCVAVFGLGIFLHFVSDMQKHMQLSLAPGLMTDGLWGRVRNPNYLGELLIYVGFSALAWHWAPFVVLTLFVGAVWIPNILKKDKSLQRYPEFAAWKARSWRFIPLIW
jgi:steroid 5-alpha reductase family enzyme